MKYWLFGISILIIAVVAFYVMMSDISQNAYIPSDYEECMLSSEEFKIFSNESICSWKISGGLTGNLSEEFEEIYEKCKDSGGNTIFFEVACQLDFDNPNQKPASPECSEVIPGHNVKDGRIDLVFIGLGYINKSAFLDIVLNAIDFDSLKSGLFSLEPFRSNKDKFNIWYVHDSKEEDIWKLSQVCREELNMSNHEFSKSEPLYSDRMFTIIFRNSNSETSLFYSGTGEECTPEKYDGRCGLKGIRIGMPEGIHIPNSKMHDLVHEFAHSFTMHNINIEERPEEYYQILDEYVKKDMPYSESIDHMNSVSDHSNCFVGTLNECRNKNDLFGDMIGDGCGEDGIIDCCTNDPEDIQQGALSCESCPDCNENSEYDIEINCYEGCWAASGTYRSTFRSLMGSRQGSYSYGKLNERILCLRIAELTNSTRCE